MGACNTTVKTRTTVSNIQPQQQVVYQGNAVSGSANANIAFNSNANAGVNQYQSSSAGYNSNANVQYGAAINQGGYNQVQQRPVQQQVYSNQKPNVQIQQQKVVMTTNSAPITANRGLRTQRVYRRYVGGSYVIVPETEIYLYNDCVPYYYDNINHTYFDYDPYPGIYVDIDPGPGTLLVSADALYGNQGYGIHNDVHIGGGHYNSGGYGCSGVHHGSGNVYVENNVNVDVHANYNAEINNVGCGNNNVVVSNDMGQSYGGNFEVAGDAQVNACSGGSTNVVVDAQVNVGCGNNDVAVASSCSGGGSGCGAAATGCSGGASACSGGASACSGGGSSCGGGGCGGGGCGGGD